MLLPLLSNIKHTGQSETVSNNYVSIFSLSEISLHDPQVILMDNRACKLNGFTAP